MHASRLTPREDRLRVMLVDDHPIVLAGLKSFLRDASGVDVVATAANADEASGRASHLRPDVFVIVLSPSTVDPVGLVRGLKSQFADVAVLVLTLDPSWTSSKELAAAGANAFMAGNAGRDALLETLDQLRADADTGAAGHRAARRRSSALELPGLALAP